VPPNRKTPRQAFAHSKGRFLIGAEADAYSSPLASQTRRSADVRNQMRQFDTYGAREHPPTQRASGRVNAGLWDELALTH
jgi:hypothetical protein